MDWQLLEIISLPDAITIKNIEQLMNQWLLEPQQQARSILRGEIVYDKIKEDKRISIRKLLPRLNKKDCMMLQMVKWDHDEDEKICYTEHTPLGFEYFKKDSLEDEDIIEIENDKIKLEELLKLPSFHPKLFKYRIKYEDLNKKLSMEYIPHEGCNDIEAELHILRNLLKLCNKFLLNSIKGYKKRVHHDIIIEKVKYQDNYLKNKNKFISWVKDWPERTDAGKFVFEDIGIATFLDLLFEKSTSFVDLGCGNGLLVHLLTQLKHVGYGIDMVQRKVWDNFKDTNLIVKTILPKSEIIQNEWLLGNHSDELSPWIPIIAARSGYNTKFVIIPCCFYNLNGMRYQAKKKANQTNYESYIEYLESIILQCGYIVEKEFLRIPSTKNLALIGRKRSFKQDDIEHLQMIDNNINNLIKDIIFEPRINTNNKH